MRVKRTKRSISLMLVILMIISIFNVPFKGSVVNAEEATYTVSFDAAGGTFTEWDEDLQENVDLSVISQEFTVGDYLSMSQPNDRDGYVFVGYQVGDDDSIIYVERDYDLADNERNFYDYEVIDDVIFKAVWEEAYKVTFDGNGSNFGYAWDDEQGKDVGIQTYTMQVGKDRTLNDFRIPAEREGYVFVGYQAGDDDSIIYVEREYDLADNERYYRNYVVEGDVTLKAVWEEAYQVTFNGNGGYVDESYDEELGEYIYNKSTYTMQVGKDCTLNDFRTPAEREGYVFVGYQAGDDDSIIYVEREYDLADNERYYRNYVVEGDVTLKAVWEEAYKVTFDGNGGYVDESYDEELGKYIYNKSTYTMQVGKNRKLNYYRTPAEREGYVFDGYQINGEGPVYTDNEYDSEGNKNEYYIRDYIPEGDTTFIAVWSVAYTMTYEANGGNFGTTYNDEGEEVDKTTTCYLIKQGEKINSSIETPIKDGFVFDGYQINGEGPVYTENEYDSEGNKNEYYIRDYIPEEDTTFTAAWSVAYTMTYEANGGNFGTTYNDEGEEVDKTSTCYLIKQGEKINSSIETPIKDGFVFDGYQINGEGPVYTDNECDSKGNKNEYYICDYIPEEDTTFTAVWSAAYTMTYEANGGNFGTTYNDEGEEVDVTSINHLVKQGEKIDSSYDVPNKDGYIFDGYQINGEGPVYTENEYDSEGNKNEYYIRDYIPEGDTTFTAAWSVAYTMTYEANGGNFGTAYNDEGEEVDITSKCYLIKQGEKINSSIETPNKDGFVFDGYQINGEGPVYSSNSENPDGTINEYYIYNYIPTGDTTFTAVWSAAYTMTYEANGGNFGTTYNDEGEEVDVTSINHLIKQGEKIDSSYDAPNKDGYIFDGYQINGKGPVYTNDEYDSEGNKNEYYIRDYIPEGDTTFIAAWSVAYTMTYEAKGGNFGTTYNDEGEEVDKTSTCYLIKQGEKINSSFETPIKDGFVFDGYQINGEGPVYTDNEYDSEWNKNEYYIRDYIPEGDTTFTAVWSAAYTMTYEANGGNFGTTYNDEGEEVDKTTTCYLIKQGEKINSSFETPIKDGFVFDGYQINGKGPVYTNDEYDSEGNKNEYYIRDYIPEEDTTFTAAWSAAYTMTYEANGGNFGTTYNDEGEEVDKTTTCYLIKQGEKINSSIETPNKEGYIFKGYQINSDGPVYTVSEYDSDGNKNEYYISDYTPERDTTFTAVWAKICVVTFKAEGGVYETWDDTQQDYVGVESLKYDVGEGMEISSLYQFYPSYRDNYTFKGYKAEGDDTLYVLSSDDIKENEKLLSDYVVNGDVTFTAVWEADKNVTFDGNGGKYKTYDANGNEELKDTVNKFVSKGKELSYYPYAPYKFGYRFKGYVEEGKDELYVNVGPGEVPEGTSDIYSYIVNDDVKFIAQYEDANEVCLDFGSGYYTSSSGPESNYKYKEFYVYADDDGKVNLDLHYYIIMNDDETLALAGWKKQGDDTVYSFEDIEGMTFDGDVKFEAVWTNGYVVTFYSEEGYMKNGDPDEKVFLVGNEKNAVYSGIIPITERDSSTWYGHCIDYWTTDGDTKQYHDSDIKQMVIKSNITFTAHWIEAPSVTYKANGGKLYSGPMSTDEDMYYSFYGDVVYSVPVERPEFKFIGWLVEDDSSLSGTIMKDISTYVVRGNVTFTAQWEIDNETHVHVWDEGTVTTKPSCTEKGVRTFTCTVCGGTKTEDIAAKGHDYQEVAGSAKEATCTEAGKEVDKKCSRCEDIITGATIAAKGHDYQEVAGSAKEATCTEAGKEADKKCSRCEDIITGATIAAKGHDYQEVAGSAKEATCTEAGKEADKKCSRCEDVITGATIAALNHDWGDWTQTKAPTCKTKGEEEKLCKRDPSHKETREVDIDSEAHSWDEGKITTKQSCTEKGVKTYTCTECGKQKTEDIKALGHDYQEVAGSAKEATCTEAGKEADKKCSRCEDIITGATIAALNHDWGDWTQTKAPTCKTKGEEEKLCKRDPSHKETREVDIDPEAHSWDEGEITTKQSCTEKGVKTYTCTECGKEKTEDIEALGHDYQEVAGSAKEATCTEAGKEADKKCSRCEDVITGATIAAKGHKIVIDKAVAATTEKTGLTEGSHCSVCGEVIKAQTVVPKLEDNKTDDGKQDGNKADDQKQDGNKADDQKQDGNKADTQKQDGNKTDDQKQDGNKADDQKQDGNKNDNPKQDDSKKNNDTKPVSDNNPSVPATTYSNEWVDGKWYGENGEQTYEGTLGWKSNSTGWWVEDSAGWYPTDAWYKIDGVWYYFKPDGYMASNEYYGCYWFNADGSWDDTYYIVWKSNSTGWWIEDISSWWPSSCWLKIDNYWYYFDASGYMVTNQYIDGYWLGADGVCY